MKAEKRKKNAPKELARLKQALSLDKKGEAEMADLQDIATVVPAEKIKKQTDVVMAGEEEDGEWISGYFSSFKAGRCMSLCCFCYANTCLICLFFVIDGKMDMDNKRNSKTLLDKCGQYPVWMNQRQARKLKAKRVAKGKGKGKVKNKKGIAW